MVAVPRADRPAGFAHYLRAAARRGRRRVGGGGLPYQLVVAVLWFGPAVVIGTWNDLAAPVAGRPAINWPAAAALLVAGSALVGLLAVMVGPVTATREWRGWVLSTPLDRGVLLRRRAAGLLMLLAVPGVVGGALLADAAAFRGVDALAAAVLGVAGAIVAGGLAMWQQRLRPAGAARGRGWLYWIGAPAAVAVVLNLQQVSALSSGTLWTVAAVGVIAAGGSVPLGLAGVGLIPLSSLASGSGAVSSVALAVQDMSLAPLAAVLATPPARRRSSAAGRPLGGTGRSAVIAIDRRRLARNRAALVRWLLAALIPYAAADLLSGIGWGASALVGITFLAAVAATSGLCGTVRQFAGVPSLAARYGLGRSEAKSAAMVLPQLGALGWAALTAPALLWHAPAAMAVAVPVVALLVVAGRARQAPFVPGFQIGQQYSQDLVRLLVRGPLLLLGPLVGLVLLCAGLAQRQL